MSLVPALLEDGASQTTDVLSDLSETQAADLEQRGRDIYQNHERFRRFCNVANHPEFDAYLAHEFRTWGDCEFQMMLLKAHQYIARTLPDATPYQRLAVLKDLLDDPASRRAMAVQMLDFTGHTVAAAERRGDEQQRRLPLSSTMPAADSAASNPASAADTPNGDEDDAGNNMPE